MGQKNNIKNKKKRPIKAWGLAILLVLFATLGIKLFIVESLVIETQRMEKTVYQGDWILVEKLTTGARLPITPLSIPFTSYFTNKVQLPYLRMPGVALIEPNDIVAFNYPVQNDPPIDKKTVLVSRCMGLPGDTLVVLKKKVFINRQSVNEPPTLQFNYRVFFNGTKPDARFLSQYSITEGGPVGPAGLYDFTMDRQSAQKLETNKQVKTIRELREFEGENATAYFPNSLVYNWNKDNMGPIVIPRKGSTVELTPRTFYLYADIIARFENVQVFKNGSQVYINNQPVTTYTFKQNYFFVLDDNRDNAKDSRYWGFLPESHVVGIAHRVLVSVDVNTGQVRWSRIMRLLN